MNLKFLFTITLGLIILSQPVRAEIIFAPDQLVGPSGPHLVIRSHVNVREKPANTGKKLGKLSKNDIVTVQGRAKGTQWLAVRREGENIGYVYAPSLTPMIDASLKDALSGQIDLSEKDKPECSYQLTYEGRAIEEDISFVSSDYLVHFKCEMGFDIFRFTAMMFMSEVPVDLGNQPIYQITLNLPEIATGYEEFLSATALYRQAEDTVAMDAVSLKAYKEKDLKKSAEAKNVKQALKAALALQLDSFNVKAWEIIAGKIPNPGDKKPQ
ncbi:MAG: SH3 domain-containing protein [Methylocystaceae bacterium]|nr:SH3 domain-containing protein [Methylocystaceae bacterium]